MLLALLALLAQAPSTVTADSSEPDVVYYGGRRVIFYAKTEEVVLLDSAWVTYRAMSVYSDSIRYDVKLHRLSAHGDVLFNSGSENITGDLLVYDIDTRKGMMRTAYTKAENGYFHARQVWLVRERVLNARGGAYTTCNHPNPHYVFYGPRVKLYMDDVAIAEPVVFRVGRAPLLAAPFWLVPVASKRKSGLMPFKVGNSSLEGLYSRNMAYYWVINDYSDATFYADVMTKKGVQFRTEGVYRVVPFAEGSIIAAYIREWDTGLRRYSLNATHNSSRFLLGSEFSASLDLVSDTSYVTDYGEHQLDWLKQDSKSSAQLGRSFASIGRLSLWAERYQDFVRHNRYYTLPAARFSFSSLSLGRGWNLSPSISASNRADAYADSTGSDTASTQTRNAGTGYSIQSPYYSLGSIGSLSLGQSLGLSAGLVHADGIETSRSATATNGLAVSTEQRFMGTGSVTQALSFDQSDNLLDTLDLEARYTASLQSRLQLFRVFGTTALGMRGLLHTATPSLGLSYSPKTERGGIFGRPDFGSPDRASLTLGLSNSFQAKVDTAGTKRDLGYADFRTGYNLITEKPSPLSGLLTLTPLGAGDLSLNLSAGAGLDLETFKPTPDYYTLTALTWSRIRTDTTDKQPRGFSLGLNHTWNGTANMLTGRAELAGWGWKLTLSSLGYNFNERRFTNYDLTLWRDLHCWEALVTYRRLGDRWDYDFLIRIKLLPDIRVGRSTFGSVLPSPE